MRDLWAKCLHRIGEDVSPQTFARWFAHIQPLSWEGESLTIQAPDAFSAQTLRSRYWGILCGAVAQEAGDRTAVHLVSSNGAPLSPPLPMEPAPEPAPVRREKPDFLNPRYNFDSFVVGGANEFAHACSLRVGEGVGLDLNPLFIYGGVGLGKTHLLHAIGHRILERRPAARVFYTSSENFINDLIGSLRRNRMAEFRNRYRKIDALMIDDIQFIAGKERTQEEFFFTFNALHESGKQIVITSDRTPKETPGLEERLKARFVWGMMADIGSPDFETKVAILQKKAAAQNFPLPTEVAHFIAEKVRSNIRELEGCLVKLMFHVSLHNTVLDLELAQEILKQIIRDPARGATVDNIQRIVADHFQVRVSDLKSKNRSRGFAVPRQIAMYLAREITHASTTEIGRRFGGKDHSTVIHSANKIREHIKKDVDLAATVQLLLGKLEAL